ncbi:hypothetical protein TanjilG_28257 [Lupinus angustifolius]|uniref:Uncharacterized protein n=1 Tax=Lupinus angustifolius TaxID=3871 RepID=A0A394DMH7_LUPAN|nr:hypothetical protein TanjilG_28257 [Lupinus angustifolius]
MFLLFATASSASKVVDVNIMQSSPRPFIMLKYSKFKAWWSKSKDEGALNVIDYAQESLKKGDYFSLSAASKAVIIDVEDCITGGDPEDTPYNDKSKLPQYVENVQKVVHIVVIISNHLIQN